MQGSRYDRAPPAGAAPRKGGELPADAGGVTARVVGWRLSALQESSPTRIIAELLPEGAVATPETTNRARAVAQAAGAHPPQKCM